jgi:DNA-binding HxlR family transcriptional regulator
MLAAPLNALILRALAKGSKQQIDLRRETGFPAQTTLRAQLGRLVEIGAVEKHRRNRFPGVLEYELLASGRDLLFVIAVLERWLSLAPEGPLALTSGAAKAAIKALAEGWSTTMLRVLAAGPRSLTELDDLISALSYPALERRLAAMRLAGLVEARKGSGRGTPYWATRWLRGGVAPLTAAARWERRHRQQNTAPLGRHDVETAFLLAAPMLELPTEFSGTCCIAVEMVNGSKRPAGVTLGLTEGKVGACTTNLQGKADAWALGSPAAWLSAVIESDSTGLELGGDCHLARAALDALHSALFGSQLGTTLDSSQAIGDDRSD